MKINPIFSINNFAIKNKTQNNQNNKQINIPYTTDSVCFSTNKTNFRGVLDYGNLGHGCYIALEKGYSIAIVTELFRKLKDDKDVSAKFKQKILQDDSIIRILSERDTQNYYELLKAMLEASVDRQTTIHQLTQTDETGNTPLHYATSKEAKLFLNCAPDDETKEIMLTAQNENNETPIWNKKLEQKDIIDFIKASPNVHTTKTMLLSTNEENELLIWSDKLDFEGRMFLIKASPNDKTKAKQLLSRPASKNTTLLHETVLLGEKQTQKLLKTSPDDETTKNMLLASKNNSLETQYLPIESDISNSTRKILFEASPDIETKLLQLKRFFDTNKDYNIDNLRELVLMAGSSPEEIEKILTTPIGDKKKLLIEYAKNDETKEMLLHLAPNDDVLYKLLSHPQQPTQVYVVEDAEAKTYLNETTIFTRLNPKARNSIFNKLNDKEKQLKLLSKLIKTNVNANEIDTELKSSLELLSQADESIQKTILAMDFKGNENLLHIAPNESIELYEKFQDLLNKAITQKDYKGNFPIDRMDSNEARKLISIIADSTLRDEQIYLANSKLLSRSNNNETNDYTKRFDFLLKNITDENLIIDTMDWGTPIGKLKDLLPVTSLVKGLSKIKTPELTQKYLDLNPRLKHYWTVVEKIKSGEIKSTQEALEIMLSKQ